MTTRLRVDRRGRIDFAGGVGVSVTVAVGRAFNLAIMPMLGDSNPVGGRVRGGFGLGVCGGIGGSGDEGTAGDMRISGAESLGEGVTMQRRFAGVGDCSPSNSVPTISVTRRFHGLLGVGESAAGWEAAATFLGVEASGTARKYVSSTTS